MRQEPEITNKIRNLELRSEHADWFIAVMAIVGLVYVFGEAVIEFILNLMK